MSKYVTDEEVKKSKEAWETFKKKYPCRKSKSNKKSIYDTNIISHEKLHGVDINIEYVNQKIKEDEEIKEEMSKTKTIIKSKKSTSSVEKYKLYK